MMIDVVYDILKQHYEQLLKDHGVMDKQRFRELSRIEREWLIEAAYIKKLAEKGAICHENQH